MNWTTIFKKFANGKYIVGLLAIPLIIFGGYSSAYSTNYNYNCQNNNNYCYIINNNASHFLNNVKSIELISVPEGIGYIDISIDMTNGTASSENFKRVGQVVDFNGKIYSLNIWGAGNYVFKITYPDPPVITGGTSNFTPIITRLINIAKEFIPYMIYIVIACLGITLAFKALKYIIGYLQNKSKGAVRGK